VPFFGDRALDRINEDDVTGLLVRLRRTGRAPKTVRNIASTLHSVFVLARRRRWVDANPCKLVDLPSPKPTKDVRYLREEELAAVLDSGVPEDEWAFLERPLYLMAAMTGLRQGELLALRWQDLDDSGVSTSELGVANRGRLRRFSERNRNRTRMSRCLAAHSSGVHGACQRP